MNPRQKLFLAWWLALGIPCAGVSSFFAHEWNQQYKSLDLLVRAYSSVDQLNRVLKQDDSVKMQEARSFVYENLDSVSSLKFKRDGSLFITALILLAGPLGLWLLRLPKQ